MVSNKKYHELLIRVTDLKTAIRENNKINKEERFVGFDEKQRELKTQLKMLQNELNSIRGNFLK